MMRLDMTDRELRELFTPSAQEKIQTAEKILKVRIIEPEQEKNDDLLVLFYAFYKEIANYEHYRIPVYKEMKEVYKKHGKDSFLLFAYLEDAPLAAVWITISGESLTFRAFGSVRKGYELHADYFLFYQAMLLAKKHKAESISTTDQEFPRDENRWTELLSDLHLLP